jgi:hypothetical protein
MKKGERGLHLLETGEWKPHIDEEIREEVEKATDDQIMGAIEIVGDFLEEEYVEYPAGDWRDQEDQSVVDSLGYLKCCMDVLKEREALTKAIEIIIKDEGKEIK